MTRKIRVILAIIILAISISLLIWGLAPSRRETRIQEISPSEMQLPTPSSFHFDRWRETRSVSASLSPFEPAL